MLKALGKAGDSGLHSVLGDPGKGGLYLLVFYDTWSQCMWNLQWQWWLKYSGGEKALTRT